MRKSNQQRIQSFQESVYAQLLTGYGIVIVAAVISFFLLHSVGKGFGSLVSAIVPTTITFFANALFEYEYIFERKIKHAWYVLLTVANALCYAAFLCVDITAGDQVYGFALASFFLAVASMAKLIIDVRSLGIATSTSSMDASDDGDISGKGGR